jgi:hypothetical protein
VIVQALELARPIFFLLRFFHVSVRSDCCCLVGSEMEEFVALVLAGGKVTVPKQLRRLKRKKTASAQTMGVYQEDICRGNSCPLCGFCSIPLYLEIQPEVP